jgi:hypothetical protein
MESTTRGMPRQGRLALSALALGISLMGSTTMAADNATPTAIPNQSNFGPFSPDMPVDSSRVLIVLMIFLAALAIAAIVANVMRNENRDTRAWAKDLLAAGHSVSTDQVAAVLHTEGGDQIGHGHAGAEGVDENGDPVPNPAPDPPKPPITVIGPTTFAKEKEVIFRTADENGSPVTDEILWKIVDGSVVSSDVKLEAAQGPITVVSVKKPGIFILQVTAAGRTPANIPITVVDTISEPKQSGLKAFFLGDGYGTINLALFLMAVVAALGAIGVVGDGTVSTIFGAMAGYIFGIAVVSNNRSGGSGSDS